MKFDFRIAFQEKIIFPQTISDNFFIKMFGSKK